MTAFEIVERSQKEGLKPTDFITVSEWADRYRVIPRDGGAKEPGKWRTSRFPFLKEIMDNMSPFSGVTESITIKGTQIGLTESGVNVFGHTCHIDPAPIMMLLPTIEVAKRHSRTKIRHTIEQTPELRERISDPRERDSDNTTLMKGFPGGSLIIAGANSAASLRNLSVKKLILDEVDAYELDLEKEGDTISIALKRSDAFGSEKKVMIMSTPTLKGFSKIEREFENSDQRYFYVPCPFCGHYQHLRWKDGHWKSDAPYRIVFTHDDRHQVTGPVQYRCEGCSRLIAEHHKPAMFEAGEWRPHNPGHRRRGYRLPSLYSPLGFLSWRDIAQEFLDAVREKDIEKLKTWKNTRLAETWDEEDDPIMEDASNKLLARRENYGPVVPLQGLVLVAGADVQRDRVEVNVAAFGYGEEWFNLEYRIIYGAIGDPVTQQALDDFLFAPWLHESGAEMQISRTFIDSGDGVNSQEIYDYVRPRQKRGLFASKGSQFARKPIIERSKRLNQGGIRLYLIGTDTAKDSIMARLAQPRTDQIEPALFTPLVDGPILISPMYVHYNMAGYDEEYFLQLYSEVPSKEKRGRRYIRYYKQVRERNEAIDCAVLCLAAFRSIRPDWKRIIEQLSKKKGKAAPKQVEEVKVVEEREPERTREEKRPAPAQPKHWVRPLRGGRRGWVNGWR